MKVTSALEIQELLGGEGECVITGPLSQRAVKLAELIPGEEGGLSFCRYETEEAKAMLRASRSSLILHSTALTVEPLKDKTLIGVADPRVAFIKAAGAFFLEKPVKEGVHPTAVVSTSAVVHPTAHIGPYCVIGERCEVGAESVLRSHVTLYDSVKIGRRVTIHAGTVIGADGFGFHPDADGTLLKFPHIGSIVIEDDVEIGSNTSIDRGALGDTVIGRGSKIDNLVHVAHNIRIGVNCRIICHAGLGGSIEIGDGSYVGIGALIKNQKKIGRNVMVGMGAVVTKDVPDNTTVIGNPARPMEK